MRSGRIISALAALALGIPWSTTDAQDVVGHSISSSKDEAVISFGFDNDSSLEIRFEAGIIFVNGDSIASYRVGGDLEQDWRELLDRGTELESAGILVTLYDWEVDGLSDADAQALQQLSRELDLRLDGELQLETAMAQAESAAARLEQSRVRAGTVQTSRILDLDTEESVERIIAMLEERARSGKSGAAGLPSELEIRNGRFQIGNLYVGEDEVIESSVMVLKGDATVRGRVEGNLLAIDGSVRLLRGARVDGDVVAVNGRVSRSGATVGGDVRSIVNRERFIQRDDFGGAFRRGVDLAAVIGMFVALASIGFGLSYFIPTQLSAVSDTVSGSFGRSFLAGLLALPLLPPTLLLLVVGLAITIVGAPLVVVAVPAFILGIIAVGIGGYLAVAQSVGRSYRMRQRGVNLAEAEATQYRSIIVGLAALMLIWVPAALLGWVPVVGPILLALAILFTWVMATAGFGAAIMSRGGVRQFFPARFRPPLGTDLAPYRVKQSNDVRKRDRSWT